MFTPFVDTLLLALAPCWAAAEVEDLGVAIKAVVFGNSQGRLARSPKGREGMFYLPYYSTTGAALVGFEPDSGERVEVPLGSHGGYGTAVGADGAVYVGGVGPGDLYRFDPATGQVQNLGGSQFGSQYIWACAASPDGRKIYGACYPTAGVVEYDLATKQLRDLGRMSDTEQYARSVCVDSRGTPWRRTKRPIPFNGYSRNTGSSRYGLLHSRLQRQNNGSFNSD
jgi:streptogramin lyase